MTDQPEVTEELLVTASEELGISRSLFYRLVAKFRTAAAGFANRSGVLVLALPGVAAKTKRHRKVMIPARRKKARARV